MTDFEKIEFELYVSLFGLPKRGNPEEIWNDIKENKELLRWAITPTKDKFNEKDLVNGLTICGYILSDCENIDKDIYQELINLIYSNEQIARIVVNGASNGGYSYLLMSLWNEDLKLTKEQKAFAVHEAMFKIGTVWQKELEDSYSRSLEKRGITDDTTVIDVDGCVNPIGAKTKSEYMNHLFNILSDTQAHGKGAFDIRYQILRNSNWSIEEKEKLIMDFWYDDEEYSDTLDEWEGDIINDIAALDNHNFFEPYYLHEYSYADLLKISGDKDKTDVIWSEIEFCKTMHDLRPQQWEKSYEDRKICKLEKGSNN